MKDNKNDKNNEEFLENYKNDVDLIKRLNIDEIELNSDLFEFKEFNFFYKMFLSYINNFKKKINDGSFSNKTKTIIKNNNNKKKLLNLLNDNIKSFNENEKSDTNNFNLSKKFLLEYLIFKSKVKCFLKEIEDDIKSYIDEIPLEKEKIKINEEFFYIKMLDIGSDVNKEIFDYFNSFLKNNYSFEKLMEHYFLTKSINDYDGIKSNLKISKEISQDNEFNMIKFYDYFWDNFNKKLELNLDVGIIQADSIEQSFKESKLSPGTITNHLWKIIFSEINNKKYDVVILDQPEDNLDIPTLKNTMIKNLRNLKNEIQFIIISHSAAVVVNGDSDEVIFVENSDNNISYNKTKIYSAHEKVINTLDGGKEYMISRYDKYNITFKGEENE